MSSPIWKASDWPHSGAPHLYEECVVNGTVIGYVLQFYSDCACYGCVNGVRLGSMESVEAAKLHVEGRALGRAH